MSIPFCHDTTTPNVYHMFVQDSPSEWSSQDPRSSVSVSILLYTAHCPKNSLNLRIKTKPITVGLHHYMQRSMSGFFPPDILHHCICSSSDRLGLLFEDSDYFWVSVCVCITLRTGNCTGPGTDIYLTSTVLFSVQCTYCTAQVLLLTFS